MMRAMWTRLPSVGGRHNRQVDRWPCIRGMGRWEGSYTKEEQQLILDKLNRLTDETRALIRGKQADMLSLYLKEKGPFNNLEELLNVPGIGPKMLRSLCSRMLETDKPVKKKTTKNKANIISPQISSKINTFVSINISRNAMSWSNIDSNKKYLLGWKLHEILFNEISTNSIYPAFTMAKTCEKEIPPADLYLFEDPGMYSTMYSKELNFHHFACILATLLCARQVESTRQINLVFIKPRIVERQFNTLVGSEKVSLYNIVDDMASQKVSNNYSLIYIDSNLYSYFKTINLYHKEHLSKSLLQGITFIDKVIKVPDIVEN
ncbi:transcription elongation factor, mitochondrial-like isoform X2 [Cimex lectularius]|nr:transcription elongation factor, mitochondrial-like isoform X2 [Cimex lectularius]